LLLILTARGFCLLAGLLFPFLCETLPSLSHLHELSELIFIFKPFGHLPAFFGVLPILRSLLHCDLITRLLSFGPLYQKSDLVKVYG